MGTVKIMDFTTKIPITMIGVCAGICYGVDVSNDEKSIHCISIILRNSLESAVKSCAKNI